MRRACLVTIMILLGSCAAQAQSATTMPGIGVTSPLGLLGSSSSAGTGLPLGATEIDPGGLSPLAACVPSDPSMMGTAATGSTNSGSTFDGGGLADVSSATSSCTSGTPTITSTGIVSPMSSAPSNVAGGTIPLGATELDSGGLSPMITVPAPTMSTPGCAGSPAMTTTMNLGATFGTAPGC